MREDDRVSFLNRILGGDREPAREPEQSRQPAGPQGGPLTDEQAIARYRYMLQTAPPEAIEQAHEEAFAKLTAEQRAMVLQGLSEQLPEHERATLRSDQDDPKTLARVATRAEIRQPGTIDRTLGPMGGYGGFYGGPGQGTTIFSSLAAGFVGSMVANSLYDSFAGDPGFDSTDPGFDGQESFGDGTQEVGTEGTADLQAGDVGGEFGSDIGGDFGGDFGGGDF
jgi:hypothetical protein